MPSHDADQSSEAAMAHAKRNLSSFKMPTAVAVIAESELPMLPTGKVDRQGLVRLLTTG